MGEKELIERYKKEVPIFLRWGTLVTNTMMHGLVTTFGDEKTVHDFVKIQPAPRLKDVDSLVEKAFYRNKKYVDPYNEITDKVGTRFVVLLVDDIRILGEIVESQELWVASKDRDYEEERRKNPLVFDYQSVHYIVRCKNDTTEDGSIIPKDTPCEVQLRTLLQHAHSELTHDTIYKPRARALPDVIRVVGRSMALIEATDDYFKQVRSTMDAIEEKNNKFFDTLRAIFATIVQADIQVKLNMFILDAYREVIDEVTPKTIEQYFENNAYLKTRIRNRQRDALLYRQPIVLLLYYVIENERNKFRELWPFSDAEIQPLFTDLGLTIDP